MRRPYRSFASAAVIAALAVVLAAGCGGGSDTTDSQSAARSVTPPRYLRATDLERELGTSFRRGLYRLAVMSQPGDDSADLGQDLPTGLLEAVRCRAASAVPAGGPWAWRCVVQWKTVGQRAKTTSYTVRDLPAGCFAAGATPRLAQHYDSTIRTYSEHPLNILGSASTGC